MANAYFTLTNSNNSLSKRFGVLATGYQPLLTKSQTIQTTLNGGLDAAFGGVYEIHTYTIRIRETEDRAFFGSKADLEAFYRLNNPNGTPSNIITLTDHFGQEHYVYMVGDHLPNALGVMIEGPTSWMVIQSTFRFIPGLPIGSGS